MTIKSIIKKRKAVRRYSKRKIPKKILQQILNAGAWGPSLHGIQPWRFISISNTKFIERIYKILLSDINKLFAGYNIILRSSAQTILESRILILIYSSLDVQMKMKKFGKRYQKFAESSEIQAISASIQNMILVAEDLGIGSCWLTMPIFSEKKISKIVSESNNKLIAVLTLGYPEKRCKRTKRKDIQNIVKHIT